jgi:hypothetical protein
VWTRPRTKRESFGHDTPLQWIYARRPFPLVTSCDNKKITWEETETKLKKTLSENFGKYKFLAGTGTAMPGLRVRPLLFVLALY